MTPEQGAVLAQEAGLDLVRYAERQSAVCRIMDRGAHTRAEEEDHQEQGPPRR
jgi:translation initiation factor IF-3